MKKSYCILLGLLACLSPIFGQGDADTVTSASEQVPAKIVTINTSVGTLKAKLYDDVPNHVRTFIERAKRGEYNGTLFTRVLPEFMIQGGAPDSRNAPAGAPLWFRRPKFGDHAGDTASPFQQTGRVGCSSPERRPSTQAKEIGYVAILYRTRKSLYQR